MGTAATMSTSNAVIKQLLVDGAYDCAYKPGVFHNMVRKGQLTGLPWRIPIQNEGSQGRGGSIQDAQSNKKPTSLVQFSVKNRAGAEDVNEYFSVATVKGSVLEGAQRSKASIVPIWDLELKNSAMAVHQAHSVYVYGDGTGTLATISSGSGTTSVTITSSYQAVNLSIGQSIQLVSGGALVGGGARAEIAGLNRQTGVITFASALSTLIPGAADGNTIINAGDKDKPAEGLASWIGQTTTLHGLNRSIDPVKLGGTAVAAGSAAPHEAVFDLVARISTYGEPGDTLYLNNFQFMDWLKVMEGKNMYQRTTVQSRTANIGYDAIQIQAATASIKVLPDRFCPYGRAYLINDESGPQYRSFNQLVHILDGDGERFLRDPTDDTYTVRNGSYYLFGIEGNTAGQGVLTGFMGAS